MGKHHACACERGRGFLVNLMTGEVIRARCKSWRECAYCAWVYGRSVQKRMSRLRGLRAFVVFTMPPDLGDWTNRDHIGAQARAMRRLAERLFRRFRRRFAMAWTREHNTHGAGPGRLHLNVLWDEDWVDRQWLSEIAAGCGFGSIVHISRLNAGTLPDATSYATKCLLYATKDLSSQCDWPKGTRRHGASRKAREQMGRPERNPDWYWSPVEPQTVEIEGRSYVAPEPPVQREYWLLSEKYLPTRTALGQPRAGPAPPIQLGWPFHTPWPEIP
jgi:hypothetical protein